MKRRKFFKVGAASILASAALPVTLAKQTPKLPSIQKGSPDIVVIGSGVFGLWSAFYMQQLGAKVTLVDAYGPGNPRGSSGGESRIVRADYGDQLMYSKMNIRAHELWVKWQEQWNQKIIYPTGRLTMSDAKYRAKALKIKADLEKLGVHSGRHQKPWEWRRKNK